MYSREQTKKVNIGKITIGGGERVKVQSMCTFKTSDVELVAGQISQLQKAGCDIVRVSVLDEADGAAISELKGQISLPLVADIHFSSALAVLAIENGCDKLRVNPGNIGGESEIKFVADCIKRHKIPVRVGANTGSIERGMLEKYGRGAEALVESALKNVSAFEKYGVEDIVISVKASDVPTTIKAYRLLAERCDYPLHLGVTEAGVGDMAKIKSAAALGSLLCDGIGDTVRVSITGDPVQEVYAAKDILRAAGLDKNFVNVISCPTCGRCLWNSAELAEKVANYVKDCTKPLKIAVMGCVVNGPGEAKDCDLGIAGAKDFCVIFKGGEVVKKVSADRAEEEFLKEIDLLVNE